MKVCTICKETKSPNEFNTNSRKKDGKQNYCKECGKKAHAAYYKTNRTSMRAQINERTRRVRAEYRQKVFNYLAAHSCVDCGESDPIVLEFDHVRGQKLEAVAVLVQQAVAWGRIEAEIAKCEVRCANCHRRKTYKECASYRVTG